MLPEFPERGVELPEVVLHPRIRQVAREKEEIPWPAAIMQAGKVCEELLAYVRPQPVLCLSAFVKIRDMQPADTAHDGLPPRPVAIVPLLSRFDLPYAWHLGSYLM